MSEQPLWRRSGSRPDGVGHASKPVGELLERLGQASRLTIAFWCSVALFWVLFIIQTGARGAVGFVVSALLFAVAYQLGRNARAKRPQPEQPRWVRPLLMPLLGLLALAYVGSAFSDHGTLNIVIDAVLLVQLGLIGAMLAKRQYD